MCVFGVSELQFELMVPLGLPKCTVGCRTMTAIRKSFFFFFFQKKKSNLMIKKKFGPYTRKFVYKHIIIFGFNSFNI